AISVLLPCPREIAARGELEAIITAELDVALEVSHHCLSAVLHELGLENERALVVLPGLGHRLVFQWVQVEQEHGNVGEPSLPLDHILLVLEHELRSQEAQEGPLVVLAEKPGVVVPAV